MAELVIAAAGAAIGAATLGTGVVALGMTGTAIGWSVGSMLGSTLFAKGQNQQGPRLGDLRVAGSEYGQVIPWVAGSPRIAGQIIWASNKREIANTQSVGKGGGGGSVTTYTYEVDLLVLLTENQIQGVSRIWSNGDLVWNGTVSPPKTKEGTWSEVRIYTGSSTQLPDPTYEAAVGVGNAPAYRGRGYVFIRSLQLGTSGVIPNLTFEIAGTVAEVPQYTVDVPLTRSLTEQFGTNTVIIDSFNLASLHERETDINSNGLKIVGQNDNSGRGFYGISIGTNSFGFFNEPMYTHTQGTSCTVSAKISDLLLMRDEDRGIYITIDTPFRVNFRFASFVSGEISLHYRNDQNIPFSSPIANVWRWELVYSYSTTTQVVQIPNIGSNFDIKIEFDDVLKVHNCYINDTLVHTFNYGINSNLSTIFEISSNSYNGSNLPNYIQPNWRISNIRIIGDATSSVQLVGINSVGQVISELMKRAGYSDSRTDSDFIISEFYGEETPAVQPKIGVPFTDPSNPLQQTGEDLSNILPSSGYSLDPPILDVTSDGIKIVEKNETTVGYLYIEELPTNVGMYIHTAGEECQVSASINNINYRIGAVFNDSLEVFQLPLRFNPLSLNSQDTSIRVIWIGSENKWKVIERINVAPFIIETEIPYLSSKTNFELRYVISDTQRLITIHADDQEIYSRDYDNAWLNFHSIRGTFHESRKRGEDSEDLNIESSSFRLSNFFINNKVGPILPVVRSKPLRAFAVSQVSPTRSSLDQLKNTFFFEVSKTDKISIKERQVEPVLTIPWEDLGTSESGFVEPLSMKLGSDLEIPAQVALSYNNMESDYHISTEYSDRLISTQASTTPIQLPIGMIPSEAKGVVDALLMDQVSSRITTTIRVPLKYARLENGDVFEVIDYNGRTFRLRVISKKDSVTTIELECVLDDVGVLQSAAITDNSYVSITDPADLANTIYEVLDIPILRDADNEAGYYVAVASEKLQASDEWDGAVYVESFSNDIFEQKFITGENCVLGTCNNILTDFTEGNVFDEYSILEVTVRGELVSSTRELMLNNLSINVALVGSEIIRYRNAQLLSSTQFTNTYRLSGLLRGQRGTEWVISTHVSNERFVELGTKLRRVNSLITQIDLPRQVKAVTLNKLLSDVPSRSFTDTAIGLKPFSPANLTAVYQNNDIRVSWQRRTRLITRYGGSVGTYVPLGEVSEQYRVRIFKNSTLIRTETIATPEYLYTSAIADGFTTGDQITFEVSQISAIVGAGYVSTTSIGVI